MNWAAYYEKERQAFYKTMEKARLADVRFSREDDEQLSEDERAAIDAYWSKYRFAYPNIDYKFFQSFKNRSGHFDVRFIPGVVRVAHLNRYFLKQEYQTSFQNKALTPLLFRDMKQPKPVVFRMRQTYYDGDYRKISFDEAVDRVLAFIAEQPGRRVIVKPNGSSGGHNITTYGSHSTREELAAWFKKPNMGAFVAQEMIGQSAFTAQFNPSSVNTIRMTTLLFQGRFYPLATLLRVGVSGSEVDNFCSGGALLGIDVETGVCNDWALTNDLRHVDSVNGVELKAQRLTVPNFEAIKRSVEKMHCKCPYIQMISWDIALDENDEPVLIECNFGGMIQMHEATTGPLFGKLTDEVLDEYLLKKFCLKAADENFIYEEYSDYVVVCRYIGKAADVTVPLEFHGKPVRSLKPGTFKDRTMGNVIASLDQLDSSPEAFAHIGL